MKFPTVLHTAGITLAGALNDGKGATPAEAPAQRLRPISADSGHSRDGRSNSRRSSHDKPGSIEQREIDRVAQLAIAEIARVQAVTAIVDRQHLDRVFGVAQGEIKIRNAVERAALADPVVDGGSMLFARRVPGVGHI